MTQLARLRHAGLLSALDEQLARTLGRIAGEHDERVLLAVALTSRQVAAGHVCLPLPESRQALQLGDDDAPELTELPALVEWRNVLRRSALVGSAADAGATPLVLDDADRLYLRRYFDDERRVANQISARIGRAPEVDEALLASGLERLFGPVASVGSGATEDLQRTAAELGVRSAFAVISGGPGTGKTSTVAKLLALIVEQALSHAQPAPRMLLLAPTGKAAVRLSEAIAAARATLACAPEVLAAIPTEAKTIHRALGPLSGRMREIGEEPALLPAELVLVDEASMVDLELMARLAEATPSRARMILLGDRHQLASVQAGAVLGDICGTGLPARQLARAPLGRAVVQLTRSYRYDEHSGIGRLARAINAGEVARALGILDDERQPDVRLCEPVGKSGTALSPALAAQVLAGFSPCLQASEPALALAKLDCFRVLCAHRRGPFGVEGLNRMIAALLLEHELIERADAAHGAYHGRPVLITHNDYRNRLWNGDVGMLRRRQPDEPVSACFAAAQGEVRWLSTARLPSYESAFALSIHKSQGSEVDEVAVVLPERASAVVTRELLYTAITRARQRVVIHSSRSVLEAAITTSVARSSGLRDALYASPRKR